jgi:hypothetical protein
MKLIISALSLSLLLTGCGSYSGSFDCPIGEGLKCASLSEVNQKLDQGLLYTGFPAPTTDASCSDCQTARLPTAGAQKVIWRSDLAQPKVYHRKGRGS